MNKEQVEKLMNNIEERIREALANPMKLAEEYPEDDDAHTDLERTCGAVSYLLYDFLPKEAFRVTANEKAGTVQVTPENLPAAVTALECKFECRLREAGQDIPEYGSIVLRDSILVECKEGGEARAEFLDPPTMVTWEVNLPHLH